MHMFQHTVWWYLASIYYIDECLNSADDIGVRISTRRPFPKHAGPSRRMWMRAVNMYGIYRRRKIIRNDRGKAAPVSPHVYLYHVRINSIRAFLTSMHLRTVVVRCYRSRLCVSDACGVTLQHVDLYIRNV